MARYIGTAWREAIAGPGLPAFCDGTKRFHSDDCLEMPDA